MKKKLKEKISMFRKKIALVFVFGANICFSITVKANSIENTTFFTGSKNLLADLTKALTVILVVLTGTLSAWRFIQYQNAQEGQETHAKHVLIATVVIGIIGATFTGILAAIFSYYGVSTT